VISESCTGNDVKKERETNEVKRKERTYCNKLASLKRLFLFLLDDLCRRESEGKRRKGEKKIRKEW
jgi:uncharacterized protein with ParB-like and HNH nuclease domain